jgi:hypothetical protein
MEPDDSILLKTYDSDPSIAAKFVGHSAFQHKTREDAPERESMEIRTIAFF